jgi:chromosome segregation ATPase
MASDVASAQAEISGYESQASAQQGRNTEISAQLERLEAAKSTVGSIRDEDEAFFSAIETYDVGEGWQGDKREDWETLKTETSEAGDTYLEGAEQVYDAILDKITELENERAEGCGLISWCYSRINDLGNWIEKQLS